MRFELEFHLLVIHVILFVLHLEESELLPPLGIIEFLDHSFDFIESSLLIDLILFLIHNLLLPDLIVQEVAEGCFLHGLFVAFLLFLDLVFLDVL